MQDTTRHFGYWNGRIVPVNEIHIQPQDLGVLRGYGVFDVMRTENGKPFLLNKHWTRLENSATILDLKLPVSQEEYTDIISRLLKKNGFAQSSIRTVLTGGPSEDAFLPEGNESFFILITPFHGLNEQYYTDGAKIITLDFSRDFPQAKITQYVTAIKNAKRRKEADALEILYVRDGKVLEASTSNVAIFLSDILVTPKQDILLGITRDLTLQLAEENGFTVEEREVSWEELLRADEVLLTATNKYIVPVVQVDEHTVGDGKPGLRTKKLMQAMQEFVAKY
jgi:branched-chain amino acid aminotransferase